MTNIVSHHIDRFQGESRVPGDKSVSHRALMFGALSVGETRITGLLEGDDVLATAVAMRRLGAEVTRLDDGTWQVFGCGIGGLAAPDDVIDMGNSGTGIRLLMGVIAGQPVTAVLTGDASLRSRPMERIMTPLREMGVAFAAAEGGRLPLSMTGPADLMPIDYPSPVASAQIKSAVLLAGLAAPGETTVIEAIATRDHTERLLSHFGAEVRTATEAAGAQRITVVGQPELTGCAVRVPADVSSAAFPLVAALIASEGELRLPAVGTNPLRAGLLETLTEMGADITRENATVAAGEPIADLMVRASKLRGVTVPAGRAASMIDEYPILAMAAAVAEGTTHMAGLAELRVKESDRLALMAAGLKACDVDVEETEDSFTVHGTGAPPAGGATIASHHDHRIAMSFLVLGTVTAAPIRVTSAETIATSFPGFQDLMNGLGADMRIEDDDNQDQGDAA